MTLQTQVSARLSGLGYQGSDEDRIAAYQMKYAADMKPMAFRWYDREIAVDGVAGPVTVGHLDRRRCMVPDFATDGNEVAEANWPEACRWELKIYFDHRGYRESLGLSQREFDRQYVAALDEWNRSIGINLQLTDNRNEAHTYVAWEVLRGSVLAWSNLANNSCSRGMEQRYDIRSWSAKLFRLVVLHEVGHLIGLPHKSGNYIMNPSIITSLNGLTPTDIRRAKNLGYGDPKTPDPPPEPDGKTLIEVKTADGKIYRNNEVAKVTVINGDSGGEDDGDGWDFNWP